MPEYSVTVEVLVDADVDTVFNAILDANNFHRWMPDGEVNIRGEHIILQKGSEIDVKVNRFGTLRWTEKVVDIVKNKIVRLEYIEGDYRGKCEYTFEPVERKTKLGMNLTVKPTKFFLRFVLFLMPKTVSRMHSESLQLGFKRLNEYLIEKQ